MWDSTSERPGQVEIEVQPYQRNGLSFINQTEHSTKNMNFDGKNYPVKDANAQAGAMSSARRVNASALEFTEKRNGKVADKQHIELSPDGKTLTMTIQPASGRKPNVLVFERVCSLAFAMGRTAVIINVTKPVLFFYRLLTKTPLPQPHVCSGKHDGNLLPSSPIAASILRDAGSMAT